MTAKQELRELVDRLSEPEAAECLSALRNRLLPPLPASAVPDRLPRASDLARMDVESRRAILRRFPPEVDRDELKAWDELPDDSVRHIDA